MSSEASSDSINLSKALQVSLVCSKNGIPEVGPKLVQDAKSEGTFLGSGKFGSCYLFCENEESTPLCVKFLHTEGKDPEKLWTALLKEAVQMIKVKDIRGMIRLVGVCLWPPALVSEYAGVPLSDLLDDRKVSETEAIFAMTQIAEIVSHLTRANLCHADLKLNNIVVNTEEDFKVTLVDLGMMRQFGCNPMWKDTKINISYAPELFLGQPLSPATQVYQVGNTFIDIILGVENYNDIETLHMALDALSLDPHYRPTMDTIVKQCIVLLATQIHQLGMNPDSEGIWDESTPYEIPSLECVRKRRFSSELEPVRSKRMKYDDTFP